MDIDKSVQKVTQQLFSIGYSALLLIVANSVFAQYTDRAWYLGNRDIYPTVTIFPKYATANTGTFTVPHFASAVSSFEGPGGVCYSGKIAMDALGTTVQRSGGKITVSRAFHLPGIYSLGPCYTSYPIFLGELIAGKYSLDLIPLGGPNLSSDAFPGGNSVTITFAVLTEDQAKKGVIEIPAQDSFQSGVGLISGWSCVAESVEISIDGGTRIKVPSESPRGDVESVCSHPNAGFGLLMNYNTMSEGEHTVQLYAKSMPLGDLRKFKVVKPKGEFARGLVKQVTVADFPEPGKTTTLDWREGEQRFGIKEVK